MQIRDMLKCVTRHRHSLHPHHDARARETNTTDTCWSRRPSARKFEDGSRRAADTSNEDKTKYYEYRARFRLYAAIRKEVLDRSLELIPIYRPARPPGPFHLLGGALPEGSPSGAAGVALHHADDAPTVVRVSVRVGLGLGLGFGSGERRRVRLYYYFLYLLERSEVGVE